MKFGKEFISQMVPEWKEAYMDYSYLKSLLREMKILKQTNRSQATSPALDRIPTLYRAFSGLIKRNNNNSPTTSTPSPKTPTIDIENQVIIVNSDNHDHQTMFLKKLDDELNKVVDFYKFKVEEVVKEAQILSKQMEALIAFRIKVENPEDGFDPTAEMNRLASDVAATTAALSASSPSSTRTNRTTHEDEIYDEGPSNRGAYKNTGTTHETEIYDEGPSNRGAYKNTGTTHETEINDKGPSNRGLDESGDNYKDNNLVKFMNQIGQEKKANSIKSIRPAPLEILNKVKMRHTRNTPRSTIKCLLNVHNQTGLNFSKENLKKVEEQLKQAFIEFYQKLRLLKSFSFLNTLAFSNIMKKYKKITSRNASTNYLQMVDESYLGSSDEVSKLVERVETTFIKHFSNSNRRKGMGTLRPKAKKERHRVTFSLGFIVGCTIALIVALGLTIHARSILDHKEHKVQYMENVFPLYSLFGFAILHMLMYAGNIYFWRRYKVNYTFILGFKKGTELGYREVFLISSGFTMLAIASVIANLYMKMDPETLKYSRVTELVPLGLVVLVIVMLICPFNIIYRSSRFFLLACVYRCICAPLYKVTLPDFFLAEQLTSQVQAIRSLEFYICYYGWGNYKVRENTCNSSDIYNTFYYIVAAIPYWSRLLQCLRRLCEEQHVGHAFNGLKYFSTIVAISVRTAYIRNKGDMNWRVIAWIASITAAIFGTYWDVFVDWGLFQKNSKNYWLRDKLLIPHKSVYFVAMVLNVLLRFAWLQTVLNLGDGFLHRQTLIALVAILEIIRRGIWNFFRLENEHLNNVGKFRAFKSVPLPFDYDEDEDKDC